MKKQTISRLAVGLSFVVAGLLSISCYTVYHIPDHYSDLPDGPITKSELEQFDAYEVRDTFGDLSDKYVPTGFYISIKKRNTNEYKRFFYSNSGRDKYVLQAAKNRIAHLHSVLHDSTSHFNIGDTLSVTIYYTEKETYEKWEDEAKTDRFTYYLLSRMRVTHRYTIEDESLVELKRERDRRFKVYPSPAIDNVTVRVDVSKSNPGKIVLLDNTGKMLEESESYDVTQPTKIKLNPYPSGTYYVQVTFKGENFFKKIIKN